MKEYLIDLFSNEIPNYEGIQSNTFLMLRFICDHILIYASINIHWYKDGFQKVHLISSSGQY